MKIPWSCPAWILYLPSEADCSWWRPQGETVWLPGRPVLWSPQRPSQTFRFFLYIHYSGPFRAGSHLSLCHKEPAKPTVGAFGCLELVLYGMRELAEHHHENIPIWDISPRFTWFSCRAHFLWETTRPAASSSLTSPSSFTQLISRPLAGVLL